MLSGGYIHAVASRFDGGTQSLGNEILSSRLTWTNFHFFAIPNSCPALQVSAWKADYVFGSKFVIWDGALWF
jgi:hypothetical protein